MPNDVTIIEQRITTVYCLLWSLSNYGDCAMFASWALIGGRLSRDLCPPLSLVQHAAIVAALVSLGLSRPQPLVRGKIYILHSYTIVEEKSRRSAESSTYITC